jgi:hypothetical protein
MTTTQTTLVESKFVETAQTTQYIANNVKAIIDSAVLANSGTAGAFVSVNMVPAAGTAGASNQFIVTRYMAPNDTYSCPELVGQVLRPGASISAISTAASRITIRVSGREIS